MADPVELIQGTLDVLVLKALSLGPRHGYAVARGIRAASRGTFVVEDRALYVALHRLEAQQWVTSEWGVSEHGRRAKYYALTTDGRRILRAKTDAWNRYAVAVSRVLRAATMEA
jgi:transcriptional regulator